MGEGRRGVRGARQAGEWGGPEILCAALMRIYENVTEIENMFVLRRCSKLLMFPMLIVAKRLIYFSFCFIFVDVSQSVILLYSTQVDCLK